MGIGESSMIATGSSDHAESHFVISCLRSSVCINGRSTVPAHQLSHLSYPIHAPDVFSINVNRSCNRFTNMIHMNRRDGQRVCYRVKSRRKRRRG